MGPPSSTFWSMSGIPIHAANPTAARIRRAPGAELGLRRLHLLGARADLGRGRVPRVARGRGPPRAPHAGARRRTSAQHARDDARRIRAGLGRQPARSRRELPRRVAAPGRDRPLVTGEPGLGEAAADVRPAPAPPPDPTVLARPAPNAIEAAGVRRSSRPPGSRELQWQLAASRRRQGGCLPCRRRAGAGRVPLRRGVAGGHAGLDAQALPGGASGRADGALGGRSVAPPGRRGRVLRIRDGHPVLGERGVLAHRRARARERHPDHAGGHRRRRRRHLPRRLGDP